MDEGLQQLQYEVYKRVGWGGESGENPYTTLNSDYLLDKLQEHFGVIQVSFRRNTNGQEWTATTWVPHIQPRGQETPFVDVQAKADSPLKALLKLIIALDNAKELPHDN